jgi:hypothetical protein
MQNFYDSVNKLETNNARSQIVSYISFQEEEFKNKLRLQQELYAIIEKLQLFLTMNDVHVNWSKIKMGTPSVN